MPAVPAIITAAGTIGGSYLASKMASSATNKMTQPLTAMAGQQGARATQMFQTAMPWLKQAGGYFGTLVGGNRAAMRSVVAPETASINEMYRGAAMGASRGLRGADQERAIAELNRQRVGQVGGLLSMVRPGAAQQLASMGGMLTGQGAGLGASAMTGYGEAGRLGLAGAQQGFQSGQAWGQLLSDIFGSIDWSKLARGGGGIPQLPMPVTRDPYQAYPPMLPRV